MTEFHTVARVGEIPAGEGRAFQVEGAMVAVFFVDDEYHAINDFCPHMGASLASGYVENHGVMCPWHAWRFSIKDGTWLDNPSGKVKTPCYPVRVIDGEIQVGIETPVDAATCADRQSTSSDAANDVGKSATDI